MTRDNNFNLIRLLAALQVMIWHSSIHLELPLPQTFIDILKYFPGVPIFFTISGFLIFSSFDKARSLPEYFRNRFLRIFPALWMAFIVSTTIIYLSGFTVTGVGENLKWILAQTTVFQNYVPIELTRYALHYPNFSLWTIPVELAFYAFVPFFFLFTKHWKVNSTWLALLLFSISYACNYSLINLRTSDPDLFHTLNKMIFPYLFYFLLGALIYLHWDKLKKFYINKAHYWLALYITYSLVVGVILDAYEQMYWLNGYGLIGTILLSQTTISMGFTLPTLSNKWIGSRDISYGIYLYHMIFINVAYHFGWLNFKGFYLVVILTFICSLISWELVEKPALKLKTRKLSDLMNVPFFNERTGVKDLRR